ncbi:MAG: TonB family protein [Polyangiaceae bacterium]|nr:TonB family protein [Polyangiaceae bacterium]
MKIHSFGMEARRHLVGALAMAAGSFGVFFLLHVMNGDKPRPEKEKPAPAAAFEVKQEKKPPKKKKSKPRPRRRAKATATKSAPAPNLGAALKGASFDLPGFEAEDIGGAGQSLLGETGKKMAMTEGAVDVVPKPARRTAPEYPKSARKKGITGYVRMSIFVNDSGAVEQVKVLEAKPSGVFEDAAKETIRSWEFQPGQYEGESVGCWVTQTMRFELKKS